MRGLPPNNYTRDLPLGTQEFTAPIQSNPQAIEAWENECQQVTNSPGKGIPLSSNIYSSLFLRLRFEDCGGSGLSDGGPAERGGGLFMGPACSSTPRPAWWPLATLQEGYLELCPHLQA
ncbi:hypothetical protein AOLI_G00113230 [Acnodon oligacanthus]